MPETGDAAQWDFITLVAWWNLYFCPSCLPSSSVRWSFCGGSGPKARAVRAGFQRSSVSG